MINEKDVENFYRTNLKQLYTDATITSPHNTDGILEYYNKDNGKHLKVLLEFKYDIDLKDKTTRSTVILQAIYYMKRIEQSGDKLPHVILIADINECILIHTNSILKYLSYNVDWNIPPSSASKHTNNLTILSDLDNDATLDVFVFDTRTEPNTKTYFSKIHDEIQKLNDGLMRKIRVTPYNIENVYNYFVSNIASKLKLSSNELANLFINLLTNSDNYYLHPKKHNKLITPHSVISIDSTKYNSLFSRFDIENYTQADKKLLTNCIDRLIDEDVRRRKGEFYTPKIWVDKAHEYIESVFGEDWKDNYVVWDNSCGLANLTKDYKFSNLIQTTLEQSDIETITNNNFNKGSHKQQLDFLNDDIPQTIIDIIKGKQLIVLMNPPYKTAGNNKRDSNSDEGVAESKTRDAMVKDKWSGYGQLYAQFMYRSAMLTQYGCTVNMCVFAKYAYLSSSSFKGFRDKLFTQFSYEKGFMFNAGEFDGTSATWPIMFSIFKSTTNP